MRRILSWVVPIFLLFWAFAFVGAADYFPVTGGLDFGKNNVLHGIGVILAMLAGYAQRFWE